MTMNSPYLEEETRESPGILETLLLGIVTLTNLEVRKYPPWQQHWELWTLRRWSHCWQQMPIRTARPGVTILIFVAISRQNVSAVRVLVAARAGRWQHWNHTSASHTAQKEVTGATVWMGELTTPATASYQWSFFWGICTPIKGLRLIWGSDFQNASEKRWWQLGSKGFHSFIAIGHPTCYGLSQAVGSSVLIRIGVAAGIQPHVLPAVECFQCTEACKGSH